MNPGDPRRRSVTGRLARLGFADVSRAADMVVDAGLDADDPMLDALGATADPDLALTGLLRLRDAAGPGLMDELRADTDARDRLLGVLGVSAAFGDQLARHPEHRRVLTGPAAVRRPEPAELARDLLRAVGADPDAARPRAHAPEPLNALRVAYRRALLHLAGRDLGGMAAVENVAVELADLASAALAAGLAIARAEQDDPDACGLAVIGMGKCGGRELNYVSDVDVVFVAEPLGDHSEEESLRVAERLAAGMIRACSTVTPEGALWQVDAALRPEGRSGPLVRTLASHRAYYERWAKTWEFQALLKARPVAGDGEIGRAYVDMLAPLVWRASGRTGFVEDVQAMRRRVEAHVDPGEADRQLKLGPGGLRDVEFAVQLLQLVHGRTDERLRASNTMAALDRLASGGYVGRDDAATLAEAYLFLRRVEHMVQLYRLRRTHLVPTDDADLRRLGRALGFRADPVREFVTRWRGHAREVRRLHEKLFYRPLLRAVARLPTDEARLSRDAARTRLEALGYADPGGALRHIEALTSGVSRRAAIQRTLLPVMLGWFADGPDPDAGLLGFRKVSDALGTTPWYLRLLRDEAAVAERMARILASSRYATDLLLRAPEAVAMLDSDTGLAPRTREALTPEALAAVRRHVRQPTTGGRDPAEDAIVAVRALRRRELFRTAAADLLGLVDVRAVGTALTDIAVVTLDAALAAAVDTIEGKRGEALPTRIAIVAMGRFGGHELGYGSDADVLFVHDPAPGVAESEAAAAAGAVAEELRRLLSLPAPDPSLVVDPGLRPEGRHGPLVRTLDSYAAYYRRWSSPWESQALLRADPVAGDAELGERFRRLIDPLRRPMGGVDDDALREIRRLKARMEAERLPRGADPSTHTKLGPGGLSDVEWTAQLLQLRYGYEVPGLRTTQTLRALDEATAAGLLAADDAETLADAWRLATRIRNAVMLVRGRASDSVPTDPPTRSALAAVLGYGGVGDLVEDYRRHARRARTVVERVFYL